MTAGPRRGEIPGLDFVAIDFETANRHRASPCAVGLVRVRGGRITKTAHWLMRPPDEYSEFEQRCVDIHGIAASDVADKPSFADLYDRLMYGIRNEVLVAHNAAFDRSVLTKAALAIGFPVPKFPWCCTRDLAKQHMPLHGRALSDYRLPTVADALCVDLHRHHDAEADAIAAAEVMIALAALCGWGDLEPIAA